MKDFEVLWVNAQAAAQAAAHAENAKLGGRFDGCGFAWVTMPGTIPFARWATQKGIASKHYPRGVCIWYSKLHNLPTQSVGVHEAAARAARNVLAKALGESQIGMGSRLD